MNATDLNALHGRNILVRSAKDHRNPPTARRGTLSVREAGPGGPTVVQVDLEFPQMFTTRAHLRTVTLSDEQIAQVLATEHVGAFALTLDDRLDPEAPAGNE